MFLTLSPYTVPPISKGPVSIKKSSAHTNYYDMIPSPHKRQDKQIKALKFHLVSKKVTHDEDLFLGICATDAPYALQVMWKISFLIVSWLRSPRAYQLFAVHIFSYLNFLLGNISLRSLALDTNCVGDLYLLDFHFNIVWLLRRST